MVLRSFAFGFGGLALLAVLGCSGGSCARSSSAAVVFPPPAPAPTVPHREVDDAKKAGRVFDALSTLISSSNEDFFVGKDETISIAALDCQETTVPFGPKPSWNCKFEAQTNSLNASVDATDPPGTEADVAALVNALVGMDGAGADLLDDPHYFRVDLTNLSATATSLSFDDNTLVPAPPVENVKVTGDQAQAIRDAFDAAGVDDATGLLLICSDFSGNAPTCSYNSPTKRASVDSEQSRNLWNVVKDVARAAGYTPERGTLDTLTIFNAYNFTDDGTTVAFGLTGDDAQPPPPPAHLGH
jgi:hypothetical protein